MSNHNYNYRDNNFRFEQAESYTLLLQVAPASFSYAVTEGERLLVWEENHPLHELSDSEEGDLFSLPYKKVVVGLPDNGFSLIPASLFNAEKTADFARFLDVKPTEKVFLEPLNAENYVIYKVNEAVFNIIDAKFDTNCTVFAANGWINAIAKNNFPNQLYLNIADDKAAVLYFKEGKLRFYNSFEFKNPDELVYFVSLVAIELQLDPHSATIVLSGDIKADDINGKRLAEFFEKVELNTLQVLALPEQIVAHALLALTALSLCGSSEGH